jgi:threonine synthase
MNPLLRCMSCRAERGVDELLYTCSACGGLLDVVYDGPPGDPDELEVLFRGRRTSDEPLDRSGVWRFRELVPFVETRHVVTLWEGNTPLWPGRETARWAGVDRVAFKHQGMNPTGSFKDTGMTAGVSQAARLGAKAVACASTGNTSASMAAYAARAGMRAAVFVPDGQIALGKLSQALDYGATTLQIAGDFDRALALVRELAATDPVYLLNSVNPFRIEGQKTVAAELCEQRGWRAPDRLVVPGGNLGNVSALGKGFAELYAWGFVDRLPKLTVVQAAGAAPLARMVETGAGTLEPVAHATTLATAIKIGAPVSWPKALRALSECGGEVLAVEEWEIAEAKAMIGKDGIGCEPASAATLAGLRRLVADGRADREEDVVCVLTGTGLKDPDFTVSYHFGRLEHEGEPIEARFANPPVRVPAQLEAIRLALGLGRPIR